MPQSQCNLLLLILEVPQSTVLLVDCPVQAVGEVCRANTECVSGLCLFWQGDARVKSCSEECNAESDCPEAMTCKVVAPFGKVCTYPESTLPPGAVGASCETDAECAEYLCDDGECNYTCSVVRGMLCPTDYACADEGEGFRCYGGPEEGGCCQVKRPGRDSRQPWAWLVGVAVVGMMIRRRRRR